MKVVDESVFKRASIALFVVCLPFDAICVNGSCSGWPAWSLLLFGVLNVDESLGNWSWWANPILFVGWMWATTPDNRPRRIRLSISIAALIFALLPLISGTAGVSEAGGVSVIEGYRIGYWLWLGAIVANLASAISALAQPIEPGGTAQTENEN